QALLLGTSREVKLGWCEIQNAGSHKEDVDLIRNGYAAGKIKLRMYNAVWGPGTDAKILLENATGLEPMKTQSGPDQRAAVDATLKPAISEYDQRFTQRTIKV